MDTNEVISLGVAVSLSLIVRFFNILLKWLARILKVEEEDSVEIFPGIGAPKSKGK